MKTYTHTHTTIAAMKWHQCVKYGITTSEIKICWVKLHQLHPCKRLIFWQPSKAIKQSESCADGNGLYISAAHALFIRCARLEWKLPGSSKQHSVRYSTLTTHPGGRWNPLEFYTSTSVHTPAPMSQYNMQIKMLVSFLKLLLGVAVQTQQCCIWNNSSSANVFFCQVFAA